MIVHGHGQSLFGMVLANAVKIKLALNLGRLRNADADFLFLACEASSLSRTCLQRTTQLSQMNTPGPAISFLTSACDLPQKLHSVMFVAEPFSSFFLSAKLVSSLNHAWDFFAGLDYFIHQPVALASSDDMKLSRSQSFSTCSIDRPVCLAMMVFSRCF